ncbi:MAG: four helix bundle protein [Candidatus Cloacimonetes bacterium]|nr:four helix bundle protein [Candidatus Cloacimonadota bacterium]
MRRQNTEYRSQNDGKPARSFQELIVWQKAHQFVLSLYKYTANFPQIETSGLTSQFRRAAISIPANIAVGFKKGRKDKVRFFNIAQESLEECRYYLILSKDLGYGDDSEMSDLLIEVSKLLSSYIKSVQTSLSKNESPDS